jgi:hypothetical protein
MERKSQIPTPLDMGILTLNMKYFGVPAENVINTSVITHRKSQYNALAEARGLASLSFC